MDIINNRRLVEIIEKMSLGSTEEQDYNIPEISVTDDIGQCDGFNALIASKLGDASPLAYKPEMNSDQYNSFDPYQKHHDFIIDYVHKDANTARDISDYYGPVNEFYLDSISLDSLISSALDLKVPLDANSILKHYKSKRDKALSAIKERDPSRLKDLKDPGIDRQLDDLIKNTGIKNYSIIARRKNKTGKTTDWRIEIKKNRERAEIPKIEFLTTYEPSKGNRNRISNLRVLPGKEGYAKGNLSKLIDRLNSGVTSTGGWVSMIRSNNERSSFVFNRNIRDRSKITRVVIHGTGGGEGTGEGQILYWSTSDKRELKKDNVYPTQFIIDRAGNITCLFRPEIATVHGSESNEEKLASVGVELINNRGNLGEYTEEQYKALEQLIFGYLHDCNISTIVTHSYNIRKGIAKGLNLPYKECPGKNFYPELFMERISKYGSLTPIGISSIEEGEDTGYGSGDIVYRFETNGRDTEIDFIGILSTYKSKAEEFMKSILLSSFENVYKNISYDFSKNIENLSVNIVPGSSGRIMMKGENAPIIQSTGGRVKTVNVVFNTSSVIEIAKLTGMFRVTGADDTKISMLMMSRSLFKAGDSKNRLRYISEYYKQDNFNTIIKNIIGKKVNRRFDEPVRIKNEFINALGINTCIPASLEITTSNENPSAYTVSITFNAINLGNRNIENLKREKIGRNVPLMPLALRSPISKEEFDNKRFSEQKLISSVSLTAMRYTMAEYMPLYVISRIAALYDNISTLAMSRQSEGGGGFPIIDLSDPVISAFASSSYSIEENEKYISRILDDMQARDYAGDISFQTWGDAAVDVFTILSHIIFELTLATRAAVGPGRVRTVESISQLIGSLKTPMKFMTATAGISGVIGAIGMIPEGDDGKKYISLNIIELIPAMLHEYMNEYFASIRENRSEEFIRYHSERAKDFIVNKMVASESNYPYVPFPTNVLIKSKIDSDEIEQVNGIRLFMQANEKSLNSGEEKIRKKIERNVSAIEKMKVENNGDMKKVLDQNIGSIIHNSSELLNYWAILIAKDVNSVLIDKGGDDILSSLMSDISPANAASFKTLFGIRDLVTTANLIIASEVYVKHVIEATNALMTSCSIDVLAGYFLSASPEDPPISKSEDKYIRAYQDNIARIRKHGSAVCKKYNLIPEVFSGNIVSNRYHSEEVRMFTGYALSVVFSTISNYSMSEYTDPLTGTKNTPFYDIYDLIFPDKKRAMVTWLRYYGKRTKEFLSQTNIIIMIISLIVMAVVLYVGGTFTAAGGLVGSILYFAWQGIIFAIAAIPLALGFAQFLGNKSIGIIIRKGNLLKLSRHLLNQVRSGISHRALIELAYTSKIWFQDILYFRNEIFDERNSSYIDFPIFSFAGEPMAPDFWISKMGHIEKTYTDILSMVGSILQLANENIEKTNINDYSSMMKMLKEKLTGIDETVIKSAESAIYNNLLVSLDYSNSGYFNGLVDSKTNITEKIAALGNTIDNHLTISTDTKEKRLNHGYVFIRVHGPTGKVLSERQGVRENTCAITINVFPKRCEVKVNEMFSTIVKEVNRNINEGRILNQRQDVDTAFNIVAIQRMTSAISTLLSNLSSSLRSRNELLMAFEPETINNIMMIRSIVGSHLMAVGRPGLNKLSRTIKENSRDMIKKSLLLRSGYMYPTVKMFFIDEDSEAYYLFDDLYSYGSIIDFAVSDDENSPIQVCELTVSNIFGNLNDVFSDRVPEYSFATDKDEHSVLNSMMLRTGCKIKIQAGSSTILTEKDTIFTGRITNIQFGEITKIQATSMGDCLLEEVSKERAKIYGDNVWLDETALLTSAAMYVGHEVARLASDTYKTPITSIKNIIGYALTDAAVRGKLDDYTINPELAIDFDENINLASSDYMTALRNKFFPDAISQILKMGGIEVNTGFNNQLMENVNIRNDSIKEGNIFSTIFAPSGTSWVSLDDTTWDILQEINMLLPNNSLRSLPYETRSTLVWGEDDDYYRYKRGSGLNTFVSTSIADTLRFKAGGNSKFRIIMDNLKSAFENGRSTGNWDSFNHSFAILALVVDYANSLGVGYNAALPDIKLRVAGIIDDFNIADEDSDIFGSVLNWLNFGTRDYNSFIDNANRLINKHADVILAYNKSLSEIADEKRHVENLNINDIDMSKIRLEVYDRDIKRAASTKAYKDTVVKMLFVEMASEFYITDIYKTCASISDSYKKISDVHMKMSGKDIISNDIMLMDAFNTAKVTYPEAGNEKAIISNMDSAWRKSTDWIPIHYKLEPRVWKTYSTFFRNVNIFPRARHSVLSMYTASTLKNLISQSYGGNIEILGDSNIKAGDRIFMYDELSDMYGIIKVGSMIRKFSRENGWTISITPRMISKNESRIEELTSTIIGNVFGYLEKIAYTMGAFYIISEGLSLISKNRRVASVIENLSDKVGRAAKNSTMSKIAAWTKTKSGNIADRIPAAFRSKSDYSVINDTIKRVKSTNPDWFDNIIKTALERKAKMESVLIGTKSSFNRTVTTAINRSFSKYPGKTSPKFTKDEVISSVKESFSEIFTIEKRTSGTPSDIIKKNIKLSFSKKLKDANPDLSPDDITRISDEFELALSSSRSLKGFDRQFIDLQKYTVDGFEKIKIPGIADDAISLTGRSILETAIFDSKPLIDDLLIIGGKAFRTFGALSLGFMVAEGIKELNDLRLNNTLTASNVAITPLFFRDEPFISNLDGMDKKDGEEVGLLGITASRIGSAFGDLTHAVLDPQRELISRNKMVFNEILRSEYFKDLSSDYYDD